MPVTWSDEKRILIYCPAGDRTHDLPHTVASNMGKVSHALTHSAKAAVDSVIHTYSISNMRKIIIEYSAYIIGVVNN